jgi:hypothetical protein
MAGIGKYKLSDALREPRREAGDGKGDKPLSSHETASEQSREAKVHGEARASNRDRTVEIGGATSRRQGQ